MAEPFVTISKGDVAPFKIIFGNPDCMLYLKEGTVFKDVRIDAKSFNGIPAMPDSSFEIKFNLDAQFIPEQKFNDLVLNKKIPRAFKILYWAEIVTVITALLCIFLPFETKVRFANFLLLECMVVIITTIILNIRSIGRNKKNHKQIMGMMDETDEKIKSANKRMDVLSRENIKLREENELYAERFKNMGLTL